MFPSTKSREKARRFAERREMEDRAPRLRERIPTLETLELFIRHEAEGRRCPEPRYVRRIAVSTSPALFWVSCSDPNCARGGHDITRTLLHGLSAREREFEGRDRCSGQVGTVECRRDMRFVARATFLTPSIPPLPPARTHA